MYTVCLHRVWTTAPWTLLKELQSNYFASPMTKHKPRSLQMPHAAQTKIEEFHSSCLLHILSANLWTFSNFCKWDTRGSKQALQQWSDIIIIACIATEETSGPHIEYRLYKWGWPAEIITPKGYSLQGPWQGLVEGPNTWSVSAKQPPLKITCWLSNNFNVLPDDVIVLLISSKMLSAYRDNVYIVTHH